MVNINWTHPRVIGDAFLMSRPGFVEFYSSEYNVDKTFAEAVWSGVREVYTSYDKGHLNSSTLKHIKPEEFAKVKLEIQTTMQKIAVDLRDATSLSEETFTAIEEVFMGPFPTKKKKVFRLLQLGGSVTDILHQFKSHNLEIDQNYIKELAVLYKKENG